MSLIHKQYLTYDGTNELDGTDWSARALTTTGGDGSGNYYSDAVRVRRSEGFSKMRIQTTASITIVYQVSDDNRNWDTPYDIDGNDLSAVVTALGSNRAVFFEPVIAEFIRFKVTCNSNATTTLEYVQKEN